MHKKSEQKKVDDNVKRIKKPSKCCYPNCLNCPYDDCYYDVLEVEDYTESNERDYDFYEQDKGVKLHKGTDEEYRKYRELAYQRRNRKYIDRHEYNQEYYKKHSEEIKAKAKEKYDTKTNTIKCRKYRNKNIEHKKQYDKEYYEKNKEEKKAKARERYYKNKLNK